MNELEKRLGYHFSNQENLRRALTCESAINERHPQASSKNYRPLEFVGDAVLKYIISLLVYDASQPVHELHDKVCSYIRNDSLLCIGKELHLEKHIIKGKGVPHVTDKMLADTVEAILGAIVIDRQQQSKSPEKVLIDIIARLFSIQPNNNIKKRSYCKCISIFIIILLILLPFAIMAIFILDQYEL